MLASDAAIKLTCIKKIVTLPLLRSLSDLDKNISYNSLLTLLPRKLTRTELLRLESF
jgi:hypothetical protein